MKGNSGRRWLVHGLIVGVLVAAGVGGIWRSRVAGFPGEHWEWQAPEKAGYSSEKLEAFSRKAGGSGCIVHGGKMIHSWGNITSSVDVASSCKPIYAYLAFQAIAAGRLGSLDDHVADWLPDLRELNADLGHKDREITFRHLLSQTSGYGLKEKPGAAFAYNDFATGMLVWVLFHEVYRLPWKQFDQILNGEQLGAALGFEDRPTILRRHLRLGRIRMSVRDMARFAWLYLRGGEWRGRRILRKDLYDLAMSGTLPPTFPRTSGEESEYLKKLGSIGGDKDQKNHLGCLGFYWWFNRATPDGSLFLPDAPPGTFMGSGYGGRFAMVVIPELDLVAVWHDVYENENWSPLSEVGRFNVNGMLRELQAARMEPGL